MMAYCTALQAMVYFDLAWVLVGASGLYDSLTVGSCFDLCATDHHKQHLVRRSG